MPRWNSDGTDQICPCKVGDLSYVYVGWAVQADTYMLPGMDENDPAIQDAEAVASHMETGFAGLLGSLDTEVGATATAGDAMRLTSSTWTATSSSSSITASTRSAVHSPS